MIKNIGNRAAYVTGAFRSALYNFSTGKVYSINDQGTQILSKFFSGQEIENVEFLSMVSQTMGVPLDDFSDYVFPPIPPRLQFVWMELTQKCNSRCIHCYQGESHLEAMKPLSINEWKNIITQCAALNCPHIQFIGGEPSICSYLPELIAYAYNSGIRRITIFTNLLFLTDELLLAIQKYKVSVNFSIYGASASVHDRITQITGSFDKLITNIKRLQEVHIVLRASIILMKENEREYERIRNLLRSLKIDNIHYDEIRKVHGGTQSPHLLTNSFVQNVRPNFRTKKSDFEASMRINTCWFGKLVIATDGSIFPCEFERNITYGNIRTESIKEVLEGDLIKKYWYLSYKNISPCRDCEYRFACKDCRPIAYAENGCMTDKNPRCRYDPFKGVWDS